MAESVRTSLEEFDETSILQPNAYHKLQSKIVKDEHGNILKRTILGNETDY